MLRVAEHFFQTDTGRMRRGNEDNFYARSPLFAVCDGMGGAQAGEVASEIAARSFSHGLPNGHTPEQGLAEIIAQANARIHAMARTDAGRAGMGTTCTAAYVDADDIAIAHVGDSRAYRLRGDDLLRLTRDHSLVGEMIEQGKLTEEQAESHPHRSIITRALGPEPDVEVDRYTWRAEPGDLYLLCSDGLTSMVPEARIKPILAGDGTLESKGNELIAAANAAGGRDNITVILFRVGEIGEGGDDDGPDDDASGGGSPPVGDDATTEMAAANPEEYEEYVDAQLADGKPRQGITKAEAATLSGATEAPTAAEVQAAVKAADEQEHLRQFGTVAMSAITPLAAQQAKQQDAPAQEPGARQESAEPPTEVHPAQHPGQQLYQSIPSMPAAQPAPAVEDAAAGPPPSAPAPSARTPTEAAPSPTYGAGPGSGAHRIPPPRSDPATGRTLPPGSPQPGDRLQRRPEVGGPPSAPPPGGYREREPSGPRRGKGPRIGAVIVAVLVILAIIAAGLWIATRAVFFIGTDPNRSDLVTIYRGLPYELPAGIKLYETWQASGVTLAMVPEKNRSTFTDHKLRSQDDAEDLIIALERGKLE